MNKKISLFLGIALMIHNGFAGVSATIQKNLCSLSTNARVVAGLLFVETLHRFVVIRGVNSVDEGYRSLDAESGNARTVVNGAMGALLLAPLYYRDKVSLLKTTIRLWLGAKFLMLAYQQYQRAKIAQCNRCQQNSHTLWPGCENSQKVTWCTRCQPTAKRSSLAMNIADKTNLILLAGLSYRWYKGA